MRGNHAVTFVLCAIVGQGGCAAHAQGYQVYNDRDTFRAALESYDTQNFEALSDPSSFTGSATGYDSGFGPVQLHTYDGAGNERFTNITGPDYYAAQGQTPFNLGNGDFINAASDLTVGPARLQINIQSNDTYFPDAFGLDVSSLPGTATEYTFDFGDNLQYVSPAAGQRFVGIILDPLANGQRQVVGGISVINSSGGNSFFVDTLDLGFGAPAAATPAPGSLAIALPGFLCLAAALKRRRAGN